MRRSRGDRAGSAGPRTARPSLSLAHAGLLARPPVAGSRPAPHSSAAYKSILIDVDGQPGARETSARDVTRARDAPRSKPARFDPDPGQHLRRLGF